MSFESSVHAKAIELTKLSFEMTAAAGSGHPTSAASLAHIVTILMYGHMRYDPADPALRSGDRLVLSEGHACPIVYAAGADIGLRIGRQGQWRRMTRSDAMRLRAIDSEIDGHPNPAEGFPFFPAATGSLGQGLSIAAGLALAARLDRIRNRIFCLVGDGESREGQIWEAIDFIVDHKLQRVCTIFNCNGYGQTGSVSHQQSPEVTSAKLQAAGLEVQLIDGHDPGEIQRALARHAELAEKNATKPVAIVARTVKGWGAPATQGKNLHGKPLVGDELKLVLQQLDATASELNARYAEGDLRRQPPEREASAPAFVSAPLPSFTEALHRFKEEKALQQRSMATRRAYGIALRALGLARPDVVALDAEVSNSTYAELFAHEPTLEQRFFECRIAEQNMVSCAVGLSAGGKLPFASTFGKFFVRAYDQLEMALVSQANLKLVGSHCGVSLAADGPSQMALPDVAFSRAFGTVRGAAGAPLLYLLQPADAYAAYALTLAMAEHAGACYLRTLRPDLPFLYDEATRFKLGGLQVLAQGKDLLVVAAGFMVHEALAAVGRLKEAGHQPTLVDLYSMPFEPGPLVRLAKENRSRVLTLEDNYGAGLGAAVCEALAEVEDGFAIKQMHVRRVPKSGRTPEDVLQYLGLSADDIVSGALSLLQREIS